MQVWLYFRFPLSLRIDSVRPGGETAQPSEMSARQLPTLSARRSSFLGRVWTALRWQGFYLSALQLLVGAAMYPTCRCGSSYVDLPSISCSRMRAATSSVYSVDRGIASLMLRSWRHRPLPVSAAAASFAGSSDLVALAFTAFASRTAAISALAMLAARPSVPVDPSGKPKPPTALTGPSEPCRSERHRRPSRPCRN